MASKNRKGPRKNEKWNYFFLNGQLHKTLQTKRSEDLIVAWNYLEGRRVAYSLSDVYMRRTRAYSVPQTAKILKRHVDSIKRHFRQGNIKKPQMAYSLDGQKIPKRGFYNEDDIRDMYMFFKDVHIGRPRKDGQINNRDYMSKAELEALLRNEKILYTKIDDETFVPVWKQPEW
jgi:hypothetical protein